MARPRHRARRTLIGGFHSKPPGPGRCRADLRASQRFLLTWRQPGLVGSNPYAARILAVGSDTQPPARFPGACGPSAHHIADTPLVCRKTLSRALPLSCFQHKGCYSRLSDTRDPTISGETRPADQSSPALGVVRPKSPLQLAGYWVYQQQQRPAEIASSCSSVMLGSGGNARCTVCMSLSWTWMLIDSGIVMPNS